MAPAGRSQKQGPYRHTSQYPVSIVLLFSANLKCWGSLNILIVASGKQRALLKWFGAAASFDNGQEDVDD